MQHDKKVVKGQINCVVPKRIGEVQVVPLVQQRIRRWFASSQSSRTKQLKPVLRVSIPPRQLKKN